MISWEQADRKLREASQLAALARRLPHVPTEPERRLLAEFVAFETAKAPFCSRAAAIAGLRDRWSRQDLLSIVRMARRLPPEIRRDRDVRTWLFLARRLIGAIRRRHRDHHHATTALNDLLNEWDPISVADVVSDEYLSYAPRIISLLGSGADETAVARELARIVEERMGLRSESGRELTHARAMVTWYRKLPGNRPSSPARNPIA
jgi:hypothetical protein